MATKAKQNPAENADGIDPAVLGLGTPESVTENPAPEGTPEPPADAPRKRGRPPGSGKKTTGDGPQKSASRKAADTADLGRQIVGLHALIAAATSMPEMVISDSEGEMLAKGVTAVAEEYGLALTGKTGAALQLFAAAGMVYVPRLIMIKAKIAAQRAAQETADENRTVDVSASVAHYGPAH